LILVDTNVLLRFTDAANPDCETARRALRVLRRRGDIPAIVPQNLYEFWAVATRQTGNFPTANGLGLSSSRADMWMSYWMRNYPLLPDAPNLPIFWRTLVRSFNVVGKKSYDARLVAAMQAHTITDLLTFNTKDFTRFHMIRTLDPHTIS
jgi:predicted nucleic acid-binding protein